MNTLDCVPRSVGKPLSLIAEATALLLARVAPKHSNSIRQLDIDIAPVMIWSSTVLILV
jgi:hypothetical protein